MKEFNQKFEQLAEIMHTLREECPWDKKQDHQTLRKYLLEETYEVLECLDREDHDQLKSELGDLMLQVFFHAEIASENGRFDMNDVLASISEKLIRRHPHVYGDVEVEGAEHVKQNWEAIKKSEQGRNSALDGIPKNLPALQRAWQVQTKASGPGFDWPDRSGPLQKIEEELTEFLEAAKTGSGSRTESEFGDLLFSIVNLARFEGINPEDALRRTVEKFDGRFRFIERELSKQGRRMEACSLEELDRLWEEAKKE